ncbi:ABC transporter substrate-binding protein [Candidatus Amarobacter glycogenicus]|uniref:ABC transporter substrate-binding protein n=1 Tax=Candidatus Amarobacter glycogenicus TaxID=3140699 RepID=UPI0031358D8F|nr:ABC transporter substrate-binding protein [Dehalococcoidia bacterium]
MRRAAGLLLLATAIAGLSACGQAEEPVPERPSPTAGASGSRAAGARTVVDMTGRSIQVGETVRTVAALSPAAADFAVALGLQVVGRPTDTPEASAPGAKATGPTISPDFNAIAALAPDLVLADAAFHAGRTRDFDRFTYPVFVLKANSYTEVLAALTALGGATGRDEAAAAAREALSRRVERVVAAARVKAAGKPAPKVLIVTGGGRDIFAGGAGSYLGDLVRLLGGVNVLAAAAEGGPVAGFGVVDVAQAAGLNPEVVLALSSGQGGLASQVTAEPGLGELGSGEGGAGVRSGHGPVPACAGPAGGRSAGGVAAAPLAGLTGSPRSAAVSDSQDWADGATMAGRGRAHGAGGRMAGFLMPHKLLARTLTKRVEWLR